MSVVIADYPAAAAFDGVEGINFNNWKKFLFHYQHAKSALIRKPTAVTWYRNLKLYKNHNFP